MAASRSECLQGTYAAARPAIKQVRTQCATVQTLETAASDKLYGWSVEASEATWKLQGVVVNAKRHHRVLV